MQKPSNSLMGCRFTICPMSDAYAEIILGALRKTDTSSVWQKTDLMSTLYVGQQEHLLDCISAVFRYTWKENLHFGGEFIFSKISDDEVLFSEGDMNFDDIRSNASTVSLGEFPAHARVVMYAGNREETVSLVDHMEILARQRELIPRKVPLAIMLKGSANSLFSFFDEMLTFADSKVDFYVLHATVSANSPTAVDWNAL